MEFNLGNPSRTYSFCGTITLTCGDNLASYFLGGYKQLSSAFRKCRFCLAVSNDMQVKVYMYVNELIYVHVKLYIYKCSCLCNHTCACACVYSFLQMSLYLDQEKHISSILIPWTAHFMNTWQPHMAFNLTQF